MPEPIVELVVIVLSPTCTRQAEHRQHHFDAILFSDIEYLDQLSQVRLRYPLESIGIPQEKIPTRSVPICWRQPHELDTDGSRCLEPLLRIAAAASISPFPLLIPECQLLIRCRSVETRHSK